jgi:hypothetical protein
MSRACAVGREFSGTGTFHGIDWSVPCPAPGYATIVATRDGTPVESYLLCLAHFLGLLDWLGTHHPGQARLRSPHAEN